VSVFLGARCVLRFGCLVVCYVGYFYGVVFGFAVVGYLLIGLTNAGFYTALLCTAWFTLLDSRLPVSLVCYFPHPGFFDLA